jgi:hypothetical protein
LEKADSERVNAEPSIRPAPFFIVGCPRSGTTLLSVLLDRHSRLCVPPETAFYDEIVPLLDSPDDQRFLEVLRRWSRLSELDLTPEAVLRRLRGQQRTPAQVLSAILSLYADQRHKHRCGEKTPQHLPHVPVILRDFPESKIFCLLRDGCETVGSLMAMPWWKPRTLAAAADLWSSSVRLAETFSLQHPDRFFIVRYEDLVTRPSDTLTFVLSCLAETFEPGQLLPVMPSNVVLPRSMEWKGQALGPVTADHIGLRSGGLPPAELDFLRAKMTPELRRHGYKC